MSNIYLCSDWHIGHKGVAGPGRFRPKFNTDEEHDQYFIDSWNKQITKRDKVICFGDMSMTDEALIMLSNLPGNKELIIGNHDLEQKNKKRNVTMVDLLSVYSYISGPRKHKGYWFTHIPIHPNELYGRINIHGHVHYATIDDTRYFNICPENLWKFQDSPFINFVTLDRMLRDYTK